MSHLHFLNKVQPEQVTKLKLGENTSCVLLKKRTISIEPSPLPILQPDGVLVKVMATDESILWLALTTADGHVFAAVICTTTSRAAWADDPSRRRW